MVFEELMSEWAKAELVANEWKEKIEDIVYPILWAMGEKQFRIVSVARVKDGWNVTHEDERFPDGHDYIFISDELMHSDDPVKAARKLVEEKKQKEQELIRKTKMAQLERLQKELGIEPTISQ